jgi:hypothetical protein
MEETAIFSTQVNNNCTVHSITYRYKWIGYPVYSKYSSGVFQERCGVKCNITGTIKIIVVAVHYATVYKTGQIISCISGFWLIWDIDAIVGRPKITDKNTTFLQF